jgi:hypothetical protein
MKQTIKLPDSWGEVTIGKYQEITAIETDDNTKKWIEIISILSNEDPEKVKRMDPVAITKSVTHLTWILDLPDEKIFKEEITINGITYKFKERLEDLSIGEWIDLEHFQSQIKMLIRSYSRDIQIKAIKDGELIDYQGNKTDKEIEYEKSR